MKTLFRLITIVLFTLFMISVSSCGSRSGKLAQEREERLNNSHSVAYVHFSGHFILVNDTIALDKLDSAVFVKQKRTALQKEYRYFLAD